MKKFLLSAICILAGHVSLFAQTPIAIPYQGVARSAAGNIVANQNISLRFTILEGNATGTVVYQETHGATTSSLGLFDVKITAGTTTGVFNPLNWQTLAVVGAFLKVEMDINGGSAYLDMGTTQLLSVPFALYAEKSGSTLGAVSYAGTWNASLNNPALTGSIGTKGFYYVVTNAGNTSLDGVNDWQVGDWAIYNGTVWEKVDNSESPVVADAVAFDPTPEIASSNVQNAIEEVSADFADMIDSYVHRTDDGISIYQTSAGAPKRFGVGGETAPECPLGIKGENGNDDRMISMTSNDGFVKWNINLNPTAGDVDGFSIDNSTTGTSVSRLFIDQGSNGFVGIGTVEPQQKLHVQGANDGGNVSMQLENLATSHGGWLISAIDDNTIPQRVSAFSIMEKDGIGNIERITVLPKITTLTNTYYNVGINETLPYATLHVSRPAADLEADINLAENTGILLLGPVTNKNLGFDSHQIQARTGTYVGSALSFTATDLHLQPYGGGVVINSSLSPDKRITIDNNGNIGFGKVPVEKIDVNGAVTFGDSNSGTPADGTVRWHADPGGSDLQVYKSGIWKSLTTQAVTDGFGDAGSDKITYNATNAKVGIGIVTPNAALHVLDDTPVTGSSTGAVISNTSSTSSVLPSDHRIGLDVSCSGSWGGNAVSKNIGLYVSDVSGQSNSNANLAAVLNGNTVIGSITSSGMVGSNGINVLAIQNGTSPTSAIGGAGVSGGGIQLYSESDALGVSTFNLMNGDGTVIKLFRSAALTLPNNNPVSSTTYGATESDVINNLRTRINELESKLQALGLLQ